MLARILTQEMRVQKKKRESLATRNEEAESSASHMVGDPPPEVQLISDAALAQSSAKTYWRLCKSCALSVMERSDPSSWRRISSTRSWSVLSNETRWAAPPSASEELVWLCLDQEALGPEVMRCPTSLHRLGCRDRRWAEERRNRRRGGEQRGGRRRAGGQRGRRRRGGEWGGGRGERLSAEEITSRKDYHKVPSLV